MSTTSTSGITHLGDQLAQLRRLSGLTQEQVAARAGVSVDVVRKLEQHRKRATRLPTLHALARALGVELTTLIGDPPAITANRTRPACPGACGQDPSSVCPAGRYQ